MKNKPRACEQQAELLKAMAHPTRLRILEILSHAGECCVCHLTAVLRQRQPYVSQHLMVLRAKGLVNDRKDGIMVYYRLADERIAKLLSLARELLGASGEQVPLAAIPESPVEGCPCPVCVALAA
jgi:DNA-binding transcriptional ArsR family regulator